MPDELRAKAGFSEETATAYRNMETDAQAKAARQRQLANAVAEFDKASVFAEGSVSQVVNGGILFRGTAYRFNSTRTAIQTSDGSTVTNTKTDKIYLGSTGLIFVAGSFNNAVDGTAWSGQVWPAGTYTYESVGAGTKTIERWATTREAAIALQSK
jgi:hypothetical protein